MCVSRMLKCIFLSNVRFADVLPVYIIENKKRNGGWYHIIRACKRFERCILDLDQKLTKFLQPNYRDKALSNKTKSVEQNKERGTSCLNAVEVNDLKHV